METKHTPTPWKIMNNSIVAEHDGIIEYITGLDGYKLEDNAAFIVRAVNCHFNLLDQLKKSTHRLRMRKDRTAGEDEAIATADKAIAKAEGK